MVSPSNGKDYSALQSNNPYRNYQYTPSFWDKFLGGINQFTGTHLFRTPQEKYAMEMDNQARAYDSQIAETQREEMFNSPEEQAQRMRAAGINPELENSGISGGQASPFDNQAVSNMPTADFGDAQSAMNIAGQIFTRISQIPMSVMSLIQSGLKIKQDSLDLFNDINEAAANFLVEHQGSDPSWWSSKSKDEILHYVMNMYQVKEQFPMVSQRRAFAAAIYERSRALSTRTNMFKVKGDYLQASTDPMNVDETLVSTVNNWQAAYNKFRLECLARVEQAKATNEIPENTVEVENKALQIKSLENDLRLMELEGVKALREHFQTLFEGTGQRGYAYAVSMADSVLNGQINTALKTLTAGLAENGLTSGDNSTPLGGLGEVVGDVAEFVGAKPSKTIPNSNGVGSDNDTNLVENNDVQSSNVVKPSDESDRVKYWRSQWNLYKENWNKMVTELFPEIKKWFKRELRWNKH